MSEVKRWLAKRKQEVVLRLLRGKGLNELSSETGQPASTLSEWRDTFLESWLSCLKQRSSDPRVEALAKERKALQQAKVGELLMDKELLEMRVARHEGVLPFAKRRSIP